MNDLQEMINVTAVKHEVEEVQVVDGGLPGHIVSLTLQVGCGSEGQHRADQFGSVLEESGSIKSHSSFTKPTWRYESVGCYWSSARCQLGVRTSGTHSVLVSLTGCLGLTWQG